MRRFCSVLSSTLAAGLAAALLITAPTPAAADLPDISGLTFDELVELREQLNLAIWQSADWQEVTVPAGTWTINELENPYDLVAAGTWTIGEDIPAGHWTIRPAGNRDMLNVAYHDLVDTSGQGVAPGWHGWNGILTGPDYFSPELTSVDLDMVEGMHFTCSKPVIFTPYTGKPDLGFK